MIIDLTHTISPETFVYPGTPRPAFSSTRTLTHDGARETLLQMGSHTGTHMDAPRHILPDGCGLDQLPPSQFCGRAEPLCPRLLHHRRVPPLPERVSALRGVRPAVYRLGEEGGHGGLLV